MGLRNPERKLRKVTFPQVTSVGDDFLVHPPLRGDVGGDVEALVRPGPHRRVVAGVLELEGDVPPSEARFLDPSVIPGLALPIHQLAELAGVNVIVGCANWFFHRVRLISPSKTSCRRAWAVRTSRAS
jgi:hypothetical protein